MSCDVQPSFRRLAGKVNEKKRGASVAADREQAHRCVFELEEPGGRLNVTPRA
jgi:hypothetical protein